jgi:hypothetical protein
MKLLKIFMTIVLMLISFASCQNSKKAVNVNECNNFITGSESALSKFPADPFNLDTFYIFGNYFYASLSYSGGCEEHCFNLGWNEMIMESYPPQTVLDLFHDSKNDMCRAFINDSIKINISDFKKKLSNSNIREILLRVKEKSFLYRF